MKKIIVAAKSLNGVIGKNNDLAWHLPADLKHFKSITQGHWLLMGRKTFDSLGKPLPGRTTIMVTRNRDYKNDQIYVASSVDKALALAERNSVDELMILGGSEIYKQTMDVADEMIITEIKAELEGDTFFPEIDRQVWEEVARISNEKDDKNPYDFDFVTYRRKVR